ncbi:hypothetical protein Adu01nite_37940 [Paractinoplanes durhamensis]|uniref:Uncharacterized protein n=1 Tax=Paractinoplanes durhamensis TaxID=113563 RepID=A0ABQ3YYS0_9ACTN|nr:hypothetical protein Adu01nite_37940 [Actinoplanes durhamensis]
MSPISGTLFSLSFRDIAAAAGVTSAIAILLSSWVMAFTTVLLPQAADELGALPSGEAVAVANVIKKLESVGIS